MSVLDFTCRCIDCRRGQSLVVWAIAEGRQAAKQIDNYLTRCPSKLPGPGGIIDFYIAAA